MASKPHSRREFIERAFRVGGLFAAFGSWNAWASLKYGSQFIGQSAPVPGRLLVSQPEDLINQFLTARGGASIYLCQMFFPTFIAEESVQTVTTLNDLCNKKMPTASPILQPRLRALPAIAAAHMLPIATSQNAEALREIYLKANRSGFNEDDPCRLVLGFIWTCMTGALLRNRFNWEQMLVGRDIVSAAGDICKTFLKGDDSTLPLIHASVTTWQFLLTYQKSLLQRERPEGISELKHVNRTIEEIKKLGGLRFAWLDNVEKFYLGLQHYEEMPPEYLQIILGRTQTKLGTPERARANLCVLIRLNLIYASHLALTGKLKSQYLSNTISVDEMNKRMFAFLVDYGVTPHDWNILQNQGEGLIPKEGLQYLGHMFERYEDYAASSMAGGDESRVSDWYSKRAPFKNSLSEDTVAGIVYDQPKAIQSALNALDEPENESARLAFVLPCLNFGVRLERRQNRSSSIDENNAILNKVSAASLSVLQNEQYAKAFSRLSKEAPHLRIALNKTTNIPAGVSLAGFGGETHLRRKEIMVDSHQQTGQEINEEADEELKIKELYLKGVRALGISEEQANRFFYAYSNPTKESEVQQAHKFPPEVQTAIETRYFEKARSAGVPEDAAKRFFEASKVD